MHGFSPWLVHELLTQAPVEQFSCRGYRPVVEHPLPDKKEPIRRGEAIKPFGRKKDVENTNV
jgi:hypothetical protein